jgi:hypothetical protein
MYSGDAYKKGAPGNADQWKGAAASLLDGTETRSRDPYLAALELERDPADLGALRKAYRASVMSAFRNHGSDDTAPGYVSAFGVITIAFERLRLRRGW